jgi:sialidase-1
MKVMLALTKMLLFFFLISSCSKGVTKAGEEVSLDSLMLSYRMTASDSVITSTTLFSCDYEGYKYFRIPAIVKGKDSTLLAFAEGRVNGMSDFGKIHIVLKRSTNYGKTWSKLKVVAQNGELQTDDPVPVVDNYDPAYPKGRIFLFYCTGNNPENSVALLYGVKEVWYITSIDNGETWSTPVNITLQVHHPYQPSFNGQYKDPLKWGYYATGPGHGLQITQGANKGRIVVPFNHNIYPKGNYAAMFYSDDHGKTFKHSKDAAMQSGETTAAELPGGKVLMNSRNQYLPGRTRILSYETQDSLGTFDWVSGFNSRLIEPVCQGSMINYTNAKKENVLLFSNPASTNKREKLSIRQSKDWGKTWGSDLLIENGSSAYSDITILDKKRVGILYESNEYKTIKFISFDYRMIP